MRPWAWVRRVLALAVTVVFVLATLVAPAFAAGKSFSSPKVSAPSSSRSFSTPKPSTPAPSRSYSTPKPSTPKSTTPSTPKSYSSPAPSTTPSTPKSYSTPNSPSYSGSDRSYSTPNRSFSSPKPSTTTAPKVNPNYPPPPTYDTSTTKYPRQPTVVIYGPSTYTPTYWHDWYWGQPWYWRAMHRPTYYADTSAWAFNWWPMIIVGGIGIWILLGVISAYTTRRRR